MNARLKGRRLFEYLSKSGFIAKIHVVKDETRFALFVEFANFGNAIQ